MCSMNIIDFEASALKRPSFPIQVAVIKTNGETYDAFIRPTENWLDNYVWDVKSEEIHRIPLAKLFELGKEVDVVARELNEFLGGEPVFCDGGEYDVNWANELYNASTESRRFDIFDVQYTMDSDHWGNYYKNKQRAVRDLRLVEHDALNDVKIIQQAVKWCME